MLFSRKDWEKNLAQTDIARRVEVLLFDEHADIPDILAAISERRAGVSLPSCDAATKLWRKVWSPERQTQ